MTILLNFTERVR